MNRIDTSRFDYLDVTHGAVSNSAATRSKVMSEIWRLDATDIASGIQTGQFSSVEATQSCLARLDAVNPRLNAVVDVLAEAALAAAALADSRIRSGDASTLLHGVPVTVKINIDWKGRPADNGVAAFKDKIASGESSASKSWRRAGAIVIGRTNAPDFSVRPFTSNILYGETHNPWDRRVTPGGSSGGAGAAVASGICPLGHGTDRGGSVRIPAYSTGVFGLRPTPGRVGAFTPSAGDSFVSEQMINVHGVLARSVRDLHLGVNAMAEIDSRDVAQVPVPAIASAYQGPKRAALWCADYPMPLHPSVAASLERAAGWLKDAGWRVEEKSPSTGLDSFRLLSNLLLSESRFGFATLVEAYAEKETKAFVAWLASACTVNDLGGYLHAHQRRLALLRDWTELLLEYPVLLMPISTAPPMQASFDWGDLQVIERLWNELSPCAATSTIGLPSVAVPTGPIDGLPTGIQIVASRFNEIAAIGAAYVIEAHAPPILPIDPSW